LAAVKAGSLGDASVFRVDADIWMKSAPLTVAAIMAKLRALPIDRKKIVRTFAALDPMWQDVRHVTRMVGIL
jgi:hypothetical protein